MTQITSPLPPPEAAVVERAGLDKTLIGGIAWTAGAKWSSQVVAWITTVIVARLLTPADYGLVGMAAIYLGLITLFSEFGIGTAIITMRDLDGEQVAQLNSVSVLFGIVGLLISAAVAVPLGKFFRAPDLPKVVIVTSLAFLILAFRTIPNSLLEKELRFKLLAVIEAIQVVAQAISTVVFALLGFGYWALVLGRLVGSATWTALPLAWRPCGFARPRMQAIKKALTVSSHVAGARVCWFGYDNADYLIVGRVLGESPLGIYAMAYNLAHVPVEKFTALVNRVTPGFFSAIQKDYEALHSYLRRLSEGLSLITFPATIGLALVSHDFVRVVLGSKWESAVLPLQLLALHAGLQSIGTLLSPLLNAVGEARFVMKVNLIALPILAAAFFVGSRWGTTGVAAGWVIVYPFVISVPLYMHTFRKTGLKGKVLLVAVWPALSGCVSMVAVVEIIRWVVLPQGSLTIRLAVEVVGGAAAYLLSLILLHRDRMGPLLKSIKTLRT